MIARLLRLWRLRPVLATAFMLACAASLFFASRLAVHTAYWASHRQEPVSGWMTVGYVARSWGLDPRALDAAAGLPAPEAKGRPQPLSEIARDEGVPVEAVIARVEEAIARLSRDRAGE
ncbi:MAG TPA: hypothetical protein PKD10_19045 [Paracoccaceae bacterium]|nr:hypothetical protein [Paracoccaceae bacterium]HMO72363.1 hypothetical protein [Paracoccaceae bacterium]